MIEDEVFISQAISKTQQFHWMFKESVAKITPLIIP